MTIAEQMALIALNHCDLKGFLLASEIREMEKEAEARKNELKSLK